MYKISIIIPTYNPDDYIKECLTSIFQQTLSTNLFEIIIILNGDVDKYTPRIKKIIETAPKDLHISFYTTTTKGVSNARNIGIEKATGEYICFIDDDDLISPTYLTQLLEKANDKTVVISNVHSFKKNAQECSNNFFICKQLSHKNDYINASQFKIRSFLAFPVAKIIHKNIIGDRRFDTRFKNGEDALFITTLSDRIKSIDFTNDDAIYYVRERNGSASRKKIPIKELINTSIKLIMTYINIYIKNFPRYNFLLFLSRIPGVIKNAYCLYQNK